MRNMDKLILQDFISFLSLMRMIYETLRRTLNFQKDWNQQISLQINYHQLKLLSRTWPSILIPTILKIQQSKNSMLDFKHLLSMRKLLSKSKTLSNLTMKEWKTCKKSLKRWNIRSSTELQKIILLLKNQNLLEVENECLMRSKMFRMELRISQLRKKRKVQLKSESKRKSLLKIKLKMWIWRKWFQMERLKHKQLVG